MNYEEFVGVMRQEVSKRFTDDYTVLLNHTLKNNGLKRQGIMISKRGVNISPTIYLEEFYTQYQKGKQIEEIVEEIDSFYQEVKFENSATALSVQEFTEVKDRILMKLINKEQNTELIKKVPHMEFCDLIIVFYVLLDVGESERGTMIITNELLSMWKMNVNELHDIAQLNGKTKFRASLLLLSDVLREMIGKNCQVETIEDLYVLTNERKFFGAAALAYDHVLEMVADRIQSNLYILPSSIHEVIIMRDDGTMLKHRLDAMVRDVNETLVDKEEFLENHAYYYDRISKSLYI